jgi:hypothetical protein
MPALSFLTVPAALLALRVVGHGLGLARYGPSPGSACSIIGGDIDARAGHLGLDFHGFKVSGGGSIRGTFVGEIRVEVRRVGRRGPETELSIRLTAATAQGLLRMRGRVVAERRHSDDPLHRVQGWLDVSDADGLPLGSTGRLTVEGTADTASRVIAMRYAGESCSAEGAGNGEVQS